MDWFDGGIYASILRVAGATAGFLDSVCQSHRSAVAPSSKALRESDRRGLPGQGPPP